MLLRNKTKEAATGHVAASKIVHQLMHFVLDNHAPIGAFSSCAEATAIVLSDAQGDRK